MSEQAVIAGLYTALTTDQTGGSFYDDLGGRIYELEAPVNAANPCAVINAVASGIRDAFDGTIIRETSVQIDLYTSFTNGVDTLGATAEKLFDLLHTQDLTVSGSDRGFTVCTNEGTRTVEEPDTIRITTEWDIESTEHA